MFGSNSRKQIAFPRNIPISPTILETAHRMSVQQDACAPGNCSCDLGKIHTKGRKSMFGHLKARPILTVGDSISTEEAIQRLTTESEGAQPVRWFEFPLAILLCVTATKDPDSGALFVLDRNRNVWLWIYCEDDACRGYGGTGL